MNHWLEVQNSVISLILFWSGIVKLFDHDLDRTLQESAISVFIPSKWLARSAYRLLGLTETLVAAILLIPPNALWKSILAISLGICFLIYLGISYNFAPQKKCGCLGKNGKPISFRTFTRAIYFIGIAFLTLFTKNKNWIDSLGQNVILMLVILGEFLLFILLSSEFDWIWSSNSILNHFYLSLSEKYFCSRIKFDMEEINNRIQESKVYDAYSIYFTNASPAENWIDKCSYFITYSALYNNQKAIIIFSTPLLGTVVQTKAAIVDCNQQQILKRYEPLDLASIVEA